jgi:hypothetical protein
VPGDRPALDAALFMAPRGEQKIGMRRALVGAKNSNRLRNCKLINCAVAFRSQAVPQSATHCYILPYFPSLLLPHIVRKLFTNLYPHASPPPLPGSPPSRLCPSIQALCRMLTGPHPLPPFPLATVQSTQARIYCTVVLTSTAPTVAPLGVREGLQSASRLQGSRALCSVHLGGLREEPVAHGRHHVRVCDVQPPAR